MKIFRICYAVIAVSLSIGAYFPGRFISLEHQWPLFEALRTTASIILAVIGVWIAIIFPHALEQLFNEAPSSAFNQTTKVRALIRPLAYSALILITLILFGLVRATGATSTWLVNHTSIIRACCFSLLSLLSFLQIWTLVVMLLPGEALKDEIEGIERRKRFTISLFSRIQKP